MDVLLSFRPEQSDYICNTEKQQIEIRESFSNDEIMPITGRKTERSLCNSFLGKDVDYTELIWMRIKYDGQ